MNQGIYEELVTQLVTQKINELDKNSYYINKEYYGSKPMNIKWELNEPLPHYLWNDAAKFIIG